MKKVINILIIVAIILSFSSCISKSQDSQQVVMIQKEENITPSPLMTPVTTVIPTIEPIQTPPKTSLPAESPKQVEPTGTNNTATPAPSPMEKINPLVFIDAGHGGNDPGTSGNGLVEKEVNLDIAKKLNQILINSEVKTYMVRIDDKFIDHKERIYLANHMNASLYISIHCDWFNNPKYGGTQTFYISSGDLKLGELTEVQYAKFVHNELINTLNSNNRGISDRPTLAALKYATMPSILIETGFISNPDDAKNLADNEYRQKIARAMASGIIKSLDKANLN